MTTIQIYVARDCGICAHSYDLAAAISERFPGVSLEVIDIDTLQAGDLPDAVFATPTWLWDGRVYSLGNPDPARLWQHLSAAGANQERPQHPS